MNSVISWSGGKDSALAFYKEVQETRISLLFTMFSPEGHTMSHRIPRRILEKQAEDIGVVMAGRSAVWMTYEDEFRKALISLKEQGAENCIFGDINLEEHIDWGRRICKEVGIQAKHPLYGMDESQVLREFIEAGFQAQIVVVKLDRLGTEYLGRTLDTVLIQEFTRQGISPAGEFGEYHTLVTGGPIFKGHSLKNELDRKQPRVLFNQGYAFWDLE